MRAGNGLEMFYEKQTHVELRATIAREKEQKFLFAEESAQNQSMSHSQVYKAEKLFMNSRLVKPRATCSILSNRFGCDLGRLTLFASYRLRLVIRIKYSRYCMSLCPSPASTSYSSALGTLLRLLFSNPFLFFLSHFCRLYHLSF